MTYGRVEAYVNKQFKQQPIITTSKDGAHVLLTLTHIQ